MLSPAVKRMRRLHSPLVHALVLVGLLPKFLVPLGYMPAAVADGGPLMLCDAYPLPMAAARMHASGADALPDAATAHGTRSDDGIPGPSGETPDHGRHGEWKRCSLGGLAALAAVTHDWRLAIDGGPDATPGVAIPVIDTRTHLVAFRSRAPPAATPRFKAI